MKDYCLIYGKILFLFLPVFTTQFLFQSFLVVAEKPKLGLYITIASGITNIILDFFFIVVQKQGIAGAAFATGIGQSVGCCAPFLYFLFAEEAKIRLQKTHFSKKIILQSAWNGLSELISSISGSITSVFYNFQLLHYLAEDGVSAYGVVMYVQFIFIAIFIGYSFGISPVISYHYGAENHQEMHSLLTKSLIIMASGGVFLTFSSYVSASFMANIFVGYDQQLYELTLSAFHIFSFSYLVSGINIFTSSFFTALNNGTTSAVISLMRSLVFQTLTVWLLPLLFGSEAIWWSVAFAEFFALLLSLTYLSVCRKKYHY